MVYSRLFRKPAALPAPWAPRGERIYAIGDIHGRLDCLDDLLVKIDADSATAPGTLRLVFVGDLIDRGPQSAEVVERARELAASAVPVDFIMGNHEEILLRSIDGDRRTLALFDRVGGRETALSYGIDAKDYDASDLKQLGELLHRAVPQEHVAFLSGFQNSVVAGDYRFVHAGIRPGVAFDEQKPSDLRWIRDTFLEHNAPFEGFVVHGHTISAEVDERPNRIGIDTGAWSTGKLTALVLEDDRRWTLQTDLAPGVL